MDYQGNASVLIGVMIYLVACTQRISYIISFLVNQLIAYNLCLETHTLNNKSSSNSYSPGNNKCGGTHAKCHNYRTFHPETALSHKICKWCKFQLLHKPSFSLTMNSSQKTYYDCIAIRPFPRVQKTMR